MTVYFPGLKYFSAKRSEAKPKKKAHFSVLKLELEALLAPFHFVAGFFSRPLDERDVQVEVDQDQRLHPVDNETSTLPRCYFKRGC